MTGSRIVVAAFLGLTLSASALHGQGSARYREFQLGADLATVSRLAGVAVTDAKILHQRPAVLQELPWRRPYALTGSAAAPGDSAQRIAFSFYNDQLFRLVVDYDRDRTEGLTDGDMIDAISAVYGPAVKPTARPGRLALSEIEQESGTPVSRWGTAEYSAVLYRSSYASGFRIIVTSTRLEALARTAAVQAIRLDEREAPQRELARQKKEADDAQALERKARLANKGAFRP